VLYTKLCADGADADLIHIPAGGSRLSASVETVENAQHCMFLDGREVFKVGVRHAEEIAVSTLQENNLTHEDLDLLIPHQANARITESVRNRLGIPKEKVVTNIDRYGNTSGATIPICLDEAVQDGRLTEGKLVMLVGFGAGFTWASALLRW
jgi:3-oxoacyl-[acyl-carrier-protein] synthase-3